jgi:hypothetical protein
MCLLLPPTVWFGSAANSSFASDLPLENSPPFGRLLGFKNIHPLLGELWLSLFDNNFFSEKLCQSGFSGQASVRLLPHTDFWPELRKCA